MSFESFLLFINTNMMTDIAFFSLNLFEFYILYKINSWKLWKKYQNEILAHNFLKDHILFDFPLSLLGIFKFCENKSNETHKHSMVRTWTRSNNDKQRTINHEVPVQLINHTIN
jgi:hypothetical protein